MSLCRPYVALKIKIEAKPRGSRLTSDGISAPQVFHSLLKTLWKYAAAVGFSHRIPPEMRRKTADAGCGRAVENPKLCKKSQNLFLKTA